MRELQPACFWSALYYDQFFGVEFFLSNLPKHVPKVWDIRSEGML